MKKILATFLSLLILISLSVSTFAAEPESINDTRQVNGISVSNSISNKQVEELPHATIDRLQETSSTLVSVSKEYYDLDPATGNLTRVPTMPESDFEITVTATALSPIEKIRDGHLATDDVFEFMAVGKWYVNPNYELTDCIGITWSDGFTLYKDEGYTYNYRTEIKDYNSMVMNDMVPEQGFAYDVDLKLFDRQNEIVIIGRVYQPDSSGSANICGTYGHVIYIPSSIDVSFSSGNEIGMSVGVGSAIEKASPSYDYFNY